MLQIKVNNRLLNLSADIKLSLSYENPLSINESIPVAHSLSFDVPPTPSNLTIVGYVTRIACVVDMSKKLPAEILFNGLRISEGEVVVEKASKAGISLQFVGAVLPKGMRKHLQNQSFGKLDFGVAVESVDHNGKKSISTRDAQVLANTQFSERITEGKPEYLAGVVAIDDVEYLSTDGNSYDCLMNQRRMFLNSYRKELPYVNGYDWWSYRNIGSLAKIIPAYRVANMLAKLIGSKAVVGSVFDTDLSKLMLVCNWHPAYQVKDSSPVFDLNKTTLAVTLSQADFMPDVPANEFLVEMLKLACCSLYVTGSTYRIESNASVLASPCELDWSSKLVDGYTISRQPGDDYVVGFSNSGDDDELTDRKFVEVTSILDMVAHPRTLPDSSAETPEPMPCYFVTSTNQYFEAVPDPALSNDTFTHWNFNLLRQSVGGTKQTDDAIDDKGSFDMTVNADLVRTNVVTSVNFDFDYSPRFDANGLSLYGYYYCPVVEMPEKRDSKLILAMWSGMRGRMYGGKRLLDYHYPSLSHCNYALDGSKVSDVNLAFEGEGNLLDRYHADYKAWISADKKLIEGEVVLSEADLHKLDLRQKVSVKGVECIISQLDVELSFDAISKAEIKLLEVKK